MTEGYEDGNSLVRVRAQVMLRDDSTGGWVPMGGGGISSVSVRKKPLSAEPAEGRHEYLIIGKKITDQTVVLKCTIKKDFEYNRVMPTFHHWKTGDKKFGLTFQTAADARAFDKGVRMAVEDLLDGLPESSQLHHFHHSDVGDDDVFMTLNLPVVDREDSRSSSGSSATNGGSSRHPTPPAETAPSTFTHPHTQYHHLHRMHYFPRRPYSPATTTGSSNNGDTRSGSPEKMREEPDKIQFLGPENYSYVQFARDRPPVHEYSYPMVDALKSEGSATDKSDTLGSLKKHNIDVGMTHPPLPTKSNSKKKKNKDRHKLARAQCRHCHEIFSEENNTRGSCEYAPDCVRSSIDAVTCISCAQCMLYHCMADAEGDFVQHPCECSSVDENCGKRWLGLALLSILVPCLWCYLPLRGCHTCGVTCGMCGRRHQAMPTGS